ncbi:MAG: glycosyltransferase family 9 protein [Nitrospiria bacterium]
MKILIVRVGRTGDMVMMTPALSALLEKYPDAEFTFLTSPDGKRTLEGFSNQIKTFHILNRNRLLSFFGRRAVREMIQGGKFDHIYCFENKQRYYQLFRGSHAQIHGLSTLKGNKHYSQLLLDVVSNGIGYDIGAYPLSLPVSKHAEATNVSYLQGLGITDRSFLLAIHPSYNGAGKRFGSMTHKKNKRWPPEFYGELSCRLSAYGKKHAVDLKILMNLMPEECRIGEKIVESSRGCAEIVSLRPDFQQYKAFLKRADLLVTPDTGPMHIASALRTPVVALFAGKDPGDCGPFAPNEQVSILRAEETDRPEIGIAAIRVEDVFTACVKWIECKPISQARPGASFLIKQESNYI